MHKKFPLIALIAFLFLANCCIKDPDPVIKGITENYLSGSGAFILNEGNFRSGNGSVSFFSYDSSKIFNHVFFEVNKRPLGDIPYFMDFLNEKGYIVVNNSGKIEVINGKTMESISTIRKLVSPRYISFITPTKAYVTSLYSDSIAVLDLLKDDVSGYIDMNHTSESIIAHEYKAYIANWTGGNQIFVINTLYDEVIDSVEVGKEPESMVMDKNGILWVLCNGGWQRDNSAELIGIDTQTDEIIKRFVFPSKTDSPTSLGIDGKGENLFYILNGVMKMNINASQLPESSFISYSGGNFYKLGINPENNEIFITDVVDYQEKGFVLRYDKSGTLISRMKADIIPGSICFKLRSLLPGR